MPICKDEFENGRSSSGLGEKIVSFLNERNEGGFTSEEIMAGLRFHTNFDTPLTARMSTFAVGDFIAFLHDLAGKGRIRMKIVKNRMYFMAGRPAIAKCPKCRVEIATPRKTWKMAGRPNKKGKRLELQIGLYDCPKHGAFRSVLSKKKI